MSPDDHKSLLLYVDIVGLAGLPFAVRSLVPYGWLDVMPSTVFFVGVRFAADPFLEATGIG